MVKPPARLVRWRILTVVLMFLGYSGYYLCRSNLSVAMPMIMDELEASGIARAEAKIGLGEVASLGILGYAIGKFFCGSMADFLGGRRNFLGGMAGSIVFTVLFALGGAIPLFTLAWVGNRVLQSLGWVGMIKITSRWFSFSNYGAVMGLLSLSFLFGDAAARTFMAILIGQGLGWRGIFFVAAGTLSALFVLNLIWLKEAPDRIGEPEPPANPENLYGEMGEDHAPESLGRLLSPLLRSPAFWSVCLVSLGFTLVRETFNTWTPTYFTEAIGLSHADAAERSAFFPLFGGASVLLAGFLGDRLGRGGRAAILVGGLVLTGLALLVLGFADLGASTRWPVGLVALIAFVLIGPYSYLAGAIALDFGGKQGSATASGLIDGVGYLGGVLAGKGMAQISVAHGWSGAFGVLAGVAWLSCIPASMFFAHEYRRRGRPTP